MLRTDRTRVLLLACLSLACVPAAWTEANDTTDHPPSWHQVESTAGQLAFVRVLTDFALHSPLPTLPDALRSCQHLPKERVHRAEKILAHAFTTRDVEAAVRWHATLPSSASFALREGFFTALARLDPVRAWREGEALTAPDARRIALIHVASTHALTDPLAALARAKLLADPLRQEILVRALDPWIRTSPDAAFAWVSEQLPEPLRRATLLEVLPWLGNRDFSDLLRLEASATDPVLRETATATIDRLIVFQPIGTVWQRLLSARGGTIKLDADRIILGLSLSDVLEYAAARPSAEVAAAFSRLAPQFDDFPHHVGYLLSVWVLHAPDDALAWAKARPPPTQQEATLLIAQPLLLESRPDLAFALFDSAPDGSFRAALAAATAQALSQTDTSRALDWTLSLASDTDRHEALQGLFHVAIYDLDFLAIATPRLAADSANQLHARNLADLWVQHDPAAASAWFATLPPGTLRDQVQETLFAHTSRHAPETAIARALELPDGPERTLLIEKLIDHQTAHRPAEIFGLIDTLPDGSGRRYAREAALAKLGAHDPQAAAALLESGALGGVSPSSIRALAIAWADKSPFAAADWIARHVAASENHDNIIFGGVSTIARHYGESSPEQALAWARSLPDPKAVRVATLETLEAMAPRFPERAWRETLAAYADERALRPVLEAIASRAPDRARRLLADSTLPAEIRAKLAASLSSP